MFKEVVEGCLSFRIDEIALVPDLSARALLKVIKKKMFM